MRICKKNMQDKAGRKNEYHTLIMNNMQTPVPNAHIDEKGIFWYNPFGKEKKGASLMKTTVKQLDYDAVMALPRYPHREPRKPNLFWRSVIRGLTVPGLAGTDFHFTTQRMELLVSLPSW